MSKPLAIAIAGCAGRMGRTLLKLIDQDPAMVIAGGVEHEGSPHQGKQLARLEVISDETVMVEATVKALHDKMDVLIDFTTPFATIDHVAELVDEGIPAVIGTTGFKPEQEAEIVEASKHIPIVKSGNMSLGVNLMTELVRRAAASLGEEFDIEITEAHHRHKIDAPSGTALMLGEAAASGRKVRLDDKAIFEREGIMPEREPDQIGFSVIRAGGIIGEHQVLFGSDDEVLRISHTALDRSLFARGALTAAKWIKGKPAGLYTMRDVLGLKSSTS